VNFAIWCGDQYREVRHAPADRHVKVATLPAHANVVAALDLERRLPTRLGTWRAVDPDRGADPRGLGDQLPSPFAIAGAATSLECARE
jgi:hypothetical protein